MADVPDLAIGHDTARTPISCKHGLGNLRRYPGEGSNIGEGREGQVVVALTPVNGEAVDIQALHPGALQDEGEVGGER